MKKIFLSILAIMVVAMFALAGCGSADVSDEETKPVPKTTTKTTPKTVETAPEPRAEPVEAEPEPEPAKQMNSKVADLLTKHTKVKSLQYMYQDPSNYPMEWPTWLKGTKMAMDLREVTEVSGDTYVSKVYLNTASKTAKGFCESKVYRCADPNEEVDLRFPKYIRKTPFDWIKAVTYAEKEAEETKQQRQVWKLKFEDSDGNSGYMWVDDYYGVPMEVWVGSGSSAKKYIFEDLAVNAVEDSDLEHQMVTGSYNN